MKNLIKKCTLFIGVLLLTNNLFGQNNICEVKKILGMETYVLNEPLRSYEIVLTKGTGAKAASLLTAGLVNEGISAKIDQFVKRIQKEASAGNLKIDAVLYQSGKKILGIKFTEEATTENKGLAKASKINGIPVFVLAEPVLEYEVMFNVSGGAKAKSYLTGGLSNNSIEQDMAQFVKRLSKEGGKQNKEFDALIYNAGKRAIAAKF